MKFIELTYYDSEGKILINPFFIVSIQTDEEGDTKILCPNDCWVYVKETPEEIMKLINEL